MRTYLDGLRAALAIVIASRPRHRSKAVSRIEAAISAEQQEQPDQDDIAQDRKALEWALGLSGQSHRTPQDARLEWLRRIYRRVCEATARVVEQDGSFAAGGYYNRAESFLFERLREAGAVPFGERWGLTALLTPDGRISPMEDAMLRAAVRCTEDGYGGLCEIGPNANGGCDCGKYVESCRLEALDRSYREAAGYRALDEAGQRAWDTAVDTATLTPEDVKQALQEDPEGEARV